MLNANGSTTKGTLIVVGIGPGNRSMRTFAAQDAICSADVVVGYKTYIELVADLIEGKAVESSGMRDETKRVNRAIDHTLAGNRVVLVSSGDPGVYGMAGLALEICRSRGLTLPVRIVPGITAANSAAALLGAPLSCDYCVLSLSDLLVPGERILRRAQAAAAGDFVTVLYNPVSRKRTELINEIRDIFLERRNPQTPVGIVRNMYRDGQDVSISTLSDFTGCTLDMMTTIVIGNSQSLLWNGRMINPRGYGP
jgi:precorrin-3B C17-methyltransferase